MGRNVKFIDVPNAVYVSAPFTVWMLNRVPHPNAAKLFANWVLTKEGQQLYSSNTTNNSRRTDVPVVDPANVTRAGESYFRSSSEKALPELQKTRTLLTQLAAL